MFNRNISPMKAYSWGQYPLVEQAFYYPKWHNERLPKTSQLLLPFGQGRSYGDSCLNHEGAVVSSKFLNHFIEFDREKGELICEAGVTLEKILKLIVPGGWFLSVIPGTQFATVGGAIANDIHGKNHHSQGNFGHHLLGFELLKSDGARLWCDNQINSALFYATIGGLGLTGFITQAKIKLKPILSPFMHVRTIKYNHVDEFIELNQKLSAQYEYTVAWVDCIAKGNQLGRGHFIVGDHASPLEDLPKISKTKLTIPFSFPQNCLNARTVNLFNFAYYHRKGLEKNFTQLVHYQPFFFPLDSIHHWNRIYGKKGFVQYQCVIPKDAALLAEIIQTISSSGSGSFLTVLKEFGTIPSLGMLSFPQPGYTYALDFPFKGQETLNLLERLDQIVIAAGGRVYPAKDARMSGAAFQQFYPKIEAFTKFIDPQFSSSFWRRVT